MFQVGNNGECVWDGFGEINGIVVGNEMVDDAEPSLDGLAVFFHVQMARMRLPFGVKQVVLPSTFNLFRSE